MSPSEQALWDRWVAERDAEAFSEIVSRYSGMVYATCRRILGNTDDAKDITQECFLHLAQGDQRIKSSLGGWLHTLATTRSLNLIRSQSRRRRREVRHTEMTEQQSGTSWEQIEQYVDDAIAGLPRELREPLIEHFLEGLTHEAIAASMGISRSAVTRRIGKGIEKVRAVLQRQGLPVAAAALTAMLSGNASCAVPASLVASLGKLAIAGTGETASSAGSLLSAGKIGGLIMGTQAKIAMVVVLMAAIGWFLAPQFLEPEKPPSPVLPVAEETAGETAQTNKTMQTVDVSEDIARAKTAASIEQQESNLPVNVASAPSIKVAAATSTTIAATSAETVKDSYYPRQPSATESVLSGFVFERESGIPIPGASVRIGDGNAHSQGKTDSVGIYRVYARPGKGCNVELLADGYATEVALMDLPAGGDTRHDFYLEPGVVLNVRVVDEKNQPVEGARVRGVPGLQKTVTDAEGRAHLKGLSLTRNCQIYATRSGYHMSSKASLQTVLAEEIRGEITLVMRRFKGGWFTGIVTDHHGHPMEDIPVRWKPAGGQVEGKTLTDAKGHYRLEVRRSYGDDILYVSKSGWAPCWKQGAKPGPESRATVVDFLMEEGHWLEGLVMDTQENPLKNIRITISSPRQQWAVIPGHNKRYRTDIEGRFRIDELPGPEVELCLRKEGWTSLNQVTKVDHQLQIVMKKSGAITGQVLEEDTGNPVTAFTVKVKRPGWTIEISKLGKTFSSDNGKFQITDLEQGIDYRVTVEAVGYVLDFKKAVKAVPEEEQVVVFHLTKSGQIQVWLIDAEISAPLQGVHIVFGFPNSRLFFDWNRLMNLDFPNPNLLLHPRKSISDSKGAFAFKEGSQKGTLFIRESGYAPLIIRPADRTRYRSSEGDALVIPLNRGGSLSGAYWHEGLPKVGVILSLEHVEDGAHRPLGEFVTDAQGRYHVNALPSGEIRIITVPQTGLPGYSKRIQLKINEQRTVDLGNDLGPYCLSGRVVGQEGGPISGIVVHLYPHSSWNQYFVFSTSTDANGDYSLTGLREGSYGLSLYNSRTSDRMRAEVEIGGDAKRDFVLQPKER